jgi:hypothetical protein
MYPKRLRGANKRGVWLYEYNSTRDIVLDNAMIYTSDEIRTVVEKYRDPQVNAKAQKA